MRRVPAACSVQHARRGRLAHAPPVRRPQPQSRRRGTRLEDRVRRRELIVDDDAIYDFFDARVPPEVSSGARFDQWWKNERQRDPHLLEFTWDMLVDPRRINRSSTRSRMCGTRATWRYR